MQITTPTMTDLFDQLGLPSEPQDMKAFIKQYAPLDNSLKLADAPIWNESQAAFLKVNLRNDSDWALLIDSLNAQLRDHPDAQSLPQAEEPPEPVGEGNVHAARRYNAAAQHFAETQDVTAQARAAAPQSKAEARDLLDAERTAAAKSAGE